MRSSRHWRGTGIGAALAACAILAAAQSSPIDRADWRDRVERARLDSAAFIGAAVARWDRARGEPAVHALAGSAAVDIEDPTLRYGDVIVHADRLVVFRGTPGKQRSQYDFKDLSGQQLGGVHDSELRAIDAVARRGPRTFAHR